MGLAQVVFVCLQSQLRANTHTHRQPVTGNCNRHISIPLSLSRDSLCQEYLIVILVWHYHCFMHFSKWFVVSQPAAPLCMLHYFQEVPWGVQLTFPTFLSLYLSILLISLHSCLQVFVSTRSICLISLLSLFFSLSLSLLNLKLWQHLQSVFALHVMQCLC